MKASTHITRHTTHLAQIGRADKVDEIIKLDSGTPPKAVKVSINFELTEANGFRPNQFTVKHATGDEDEIEDIFINYRKKK